MSNDLIINESSWDISKAEREFDEISQLCQKLLKTKHYQAMKPEGIFAIVQKARAMNLDPLRALNGGMYCVNGKVEMSGQMMNRLIRQHGHSIVRDPKSNDEICILHGKRADNGDSMTESFSMKDAQRAGIGSSPVWKAYPRNMLFNRCLSNLARMLFPDVIDGVYVEGEVRDLGPVRIVQDVEPTGALLSSLQVEELRSLVGHDEAKELMITDFYGEDWSKIPPNDFAKLIEELS